MPTIESLEKRIDNLTNRVRKLEAMLPKSDPEKKRSINKFRPPANRLHLPIMRIANIKDFDTMMCSDAHECAMARMIMLFILDKKIGFNPTRIEIGVEEQMIYRVRRRFTRDYKAGKIKSEYLALIKENGIEI